MLKEITCPATVQLDSEQPVARGKVMPEGSESAGPIKTGPVAQALPPIPTPLRRRWKEFRVRVVPVLVFLVVLATACFLWRWYVAPPNLGG